MHDPKLHAFMAEIMDIQPGMPGLGSSGSGIMGTVGTQGMVGDRLKVTALEFAAEYSNPQADRNKVAELASDLEGALLSTRIVSGISETKLERLIETLHSFRDTVR